MTLERLNKRLAKLQKRTVKLHNCNCQLEIAVFQRSKM